MRADVGHDHAGTFQCNQLIQNNADLKLNQMNTGTWPCLSHKGYLHRSSLGHELPSAV